VIRLMSSPNNNSDELKKKCDEFIAYIEPQLTKNIETDFFIVEMALINQSNPEDRTGGLCWNTALRFLYTHDKIAEGRSNMCKLFRSEYGQIRVKMDALNAKLGNKNLFGRPRVELQKEKNKLYAILRSILASKYRAKLMSQRVSLLSKRIGTAQEENTVETDDKTKEEKSVTVDYREVIKESQGTSEEEKTLASERQGVLMSFFEELHELSKQPDLSDRFWTAVRTIETSISYANLLEVANLELKVTKIMGKMLNNMHKERELIFTDNETEDADASISDCITIHFGKDWAKSCTNQTDEHKDEIKNRLSYVYWKTANARKLHQSVKNIHEDMIENVKGGWVKWLQKQISKCSGKQIALSGEKECLDALLAENTESKFDVKFVGSKDATSDVDLAVVCPALFHNGVFLLEETMASFFLRRQFAVIVKPRARRPEKTNTKRTEKTKRRVSPTQDLWEELALAIPMQETLPSSVPENQTMEIRMRPSKSNDSHDLPQIGFNYISWEEYKPANDGTGSFVATRYDTCTYALSFDRIFSVDVTFKSKERPCIRTVIEKIWISVGSKVGRIYADLIEIVKHACHILQSAVNVRSRVPGHEDNEDGNKSALRTTFFNRTNIMVILIQSALYDSICTDKSETQPKQVLTHHDVLKLAKRKMNNLIQYTTQHQTNRDKEPNVPSSVVVGLGRPQNKVHFEYTIRFVEDVVGIWIDVIDKYMEQFPLGGIRPQGEQLRGGPLPTKTVTLDEFKQSVEVLKRILDYHPNGDDRIPGVNYGDGRMQRVTYSELERIGEAKMRFILEVGQGLTIRVPNRPQFVIYGCEPKDFLFNQGSNETIITVQCSGPTSMHGVVGPLLSSLRPLEVRLTSISARPLLVVKDITTQQATFDSNTTHIPIEFTSYAQACIQLTNHISQSLRMIKNTHSEELREIIDKLQANPTYTELKTKFEKDVIKQCPLIPLALFLTNQLKNLHVLLPNASVENISGFFKFKDNTSKLKHYCHTATRLEFYGVHIAIGMTKAIRSTGLYKTALAENKKYILNFPHLHPKKYDAQH